MRLRVDMPGKHAKHAQVEAGEAEASSVCPTAPDAEDASKVPDASGVPDATDSADAPAAPDGPTATEAPTAPDEPAAKEAPAAADAGTGADADAESTPATEGLSEDIKPQATDALSSQAADHPAASLSVIDPSTGAYVEATPKKKRHALRAVLITLGIIVAALAVAYGVGVSVFSGHFLPNSWFGSENISMDTAADIEGSISKRVKSYQLDVVGGAFSYRASAEQLNLKVDAAKMAQEMLESQNQWLWPLLLLEGRQEIDSEFALSYDAEALKAEIEEKVAAYNKNATPPQNATVVYDDASDVFIVQPEVAGTQYEPSAVSAAAHEAVMSLTPLASLQPDQLVQPTIKAGDEALSVAAAEATRMISAHVHLKLDGEDAGEIGPDDLHDLVKFDDDLNVSIDEDALNVWIDGVVKRYDTVGSERSYTRPDGKEITVSGGAYGWDVDHDTLRQAVLDAVESGADTDLEIPCWSTAQVFNGQGKPDWGNRYVDVDLSEQHVRFYNEDSEIIWESDCISGRPDGEHDTVEGVWKINNKESPSKLIGRDRNGKKEYETTVQYWMAFEENSIGFHDATWQPGFGGNMYRQGYGSHGCVNLSYADAQSLYEIIDWDDVVIVHW